MSDPLTGSAPGTQLVDLVRVMARLRAECDWKSVQTHRSLARYLLEETYETLEAIDTGDLVHLREELGDLLLQVYFHAEIAAQRGDFDIDDVAGDLIAKLVRRNPHVFGDASASGAASVNELWESVKATEKRRDSVLDGIPPTLPALLYADKVLDRLSRAGQQPVVEELSVVEPVETSGPSVVEPVETSGPSVVEPVETTGPSVVEPVETTRGEADLGARLLALVAECRERGVDPEQALRDAVRRLL